MRIIAGEFRGRRLLTPSGDQTRPVTDRVKQSIFDILAPRIEKAIVYDCFAGTGSFGIEALSRGAKHVTFFEAHRPTANLLRQNVAMVDALERAKFVTSDWFSHFEMTEGGRDVDIIFLDPPYRYLNERAEELRTAGAALATHLSADGIVCFRHDAADALALDKLQPIDVRRYGSMTVELLKSTLPSKPAPTSEPMPL